MRQENNGQKKYVLLKLIALLFLMFQLTKAYFPSLDLMNKKKSSFYTKRIHQENNNV